MKVHLTCSTPRRSIVVTLQAARTLLARVGHSVSMSWPECWEDAGGQRQLGFSREALGAADIIVHAVADDETLPTEIQAAALVKPVLRLMPGRHLGEGLALEDLVGAVATAGAARVG